MSCSPGCSRFGLVIFTKVETDLHLNHILFGNILGLTDGDLRETRSLSPACCCW